MTPPMGFTTITDPETGQPFDVDVRRYLSITWSDIVAHPDLDERGKHRARGTGVDYAEGARLTDPRRMAVYFAKYGTAGRKKYQHHIPRELLISVLICNECGHEYSEERDECPTAVAWMLSWPIPAAVPADSGLSRSTPRTRHPPSHIRCGHRGRARPTPLVPRQKAHQTDHGAARRTRPPAASVTDAAANANSRWPTTEDSLSSTMVLLWFPNSPGISMQ
jgi:hypothetical protein